MMQDRLRSPQTVGKEAVDRVLLNGYKSVIVIQDGKNIICMGDKKLNDLVTDALKFKQAQALN